MMQNKRNRHLKWNEIIVLLCSMFIEPQSGREKKGWIEVVCGSMFSGKTEELLRRLRRAQIAGRRVEIFKPSVDIRYGEDQVVSHDQNAIRSTAVAHSENIFLLAEGTEVIGIDEAQFLDAQLPEVCEKLARKGIRVIVAGLDMDFEGKPFGCMPALLAVADYITKVHAICLQCGDIAHFSFRKGDSKSRILLGEKDVYEPRCRTCYYKGDLE
jgi:thymidine kinase